MRKSSSDPVVDPGVQGTMAYYPMQKYAENKDIDITLVDYFYRVFLFVCVDPVVLSIPRPDMMGDVICSTYYDLVENDKRMRCERPGNITLEQAIIGSFQLYIYMTHAFAKKIEKAKLFFLYG